MDRAELLSEFESRVDKFEKFRGFIDKAKSQSGKFAAAVVEKVIADNEERSIEVVGEIIPLMADLQEAIETLEGEKAGALENAKESKFRLEELELRQMIGDLSDEAFEAEASEYKSVVSTTDERVGEIDAELGTIQAALERWQTAGLAAGVIDEKAEEPVVEEEEPIEIEEADEEAFAGDDKGDGSHVESVSISEDVSVVFDDEEDDEGFEVGDLDILGDDGDELELEAGEAEEDDAGDDDAGDEDSKPRRAVLLYQEGTAEEQIYPFTGDVMSLGRGRDNDIQVKNDSKVSRYHCKLYRRGPNFYIEDNKSANGSLVNGELITERRLFGGEEVIIGETFFRFRILD